MFSLVESSSYLKEGQKFKRELADNEKFENDFVGASEQDCQKWALEQQSRNKSFEHNILAIVDQRGVTDETLHLQIYNEGEGLDMADFGPLPREANTWYCFRVSYKEVETVHSVLYYGPTEAWPVYYGCKDELTDEQGIFQVAKAQKLLLDTETWLSLG